MGTESPTSATTSSTPTSSPRSPPSSASPLASTATAIRSPSDEPPFHPRIHGTHALLSPPLFILPEGPGRALRARRPVREALRRPLERRRSGGVPGALADRQVSGAPRRRARPHRARVHHPPR